MPIAANTCLNPSRLRAAISSTLITGLLAGCSANPLNFATSAINTPPPAQPASLARSATTKDAKVRIALILPMAGMGPQAMVAKGLKQAAELALFEHNSENIQLIVKDDYGTPSGATAATQQAIAEGAEVILGPLTASTVPAAAQTARAKNIPVIAFSNDVSVAGPGVYLLSFLAQQETQRVVTYAGAQGKRRFAALIPATPYGDAVEPAFRQAVTAAGGTVVAIERYPLDANKMLEPTQRVLTAVNSNSADALFIPGGDDVLALMGPQLTYAGLDGTRVKLLGTSAWDTAAIARQPAFLGGWFAGPDMRGFAAFSDRFRKTFGTTPPRLASLSYDAMNLVITLASEQNPAKYSQPSVTRAGGYMGVDGVVRFTANGYADRGLAVNEVATTGPRLIEPAPLSFAPVQVSSAAPTY